MDITDKAYGCLIGGAIGDALGAPVEGWTRERIEDEYGTVEDFKQYYMPYSNTEPGAVTSDTTLRQLVGLAIVKKGRRISPADFGDILCDRLNPDRVWISEEIALQKLSAGMNPWETGAGAVPDNKITSAITPVGIVNVGNPAQAYQDGYVIASTVQDGHYRHATATVAAGIAEAASPSATVESVLETMVEHSSGVVARAIDLAIGFAEESGSVDELFDSLYDDFLDWRWPPVNWNREKYHSGKVFSASALEVLPVAMAIVQVCEGDVNQSIVNGVTYGRDSDAVASLTGSITGALCGANSIRDDWKMKCEHANREFFQELEGNSDADFRSMARRLVNVLEDEWHRTQERADLLNEVLDGRK
ncbi:ADP-ribosylglycohydrolase family protein [Halegenticoccus tardaugens]|uniref:ADP-ribosylglycohydrolase family protein n=1 Tax=Halegenticoccus tardaugens TaxID=2071624 RepID=UPI001E289221|nr:ADP-ribosylglycohydrolase family protein [Halegenticoccus tardaugens]